MIPRSVRNVIPGSTVSAFLSVVPVRPAVLAHPSCTVASTAAACSMSSALMFWSLTRISRRFPTAARAAAANRALDSPPSGRFQASALAPAGCRSSSRWFRRRSSRMSVGPFSVIRSLFGNAFSELRALG